jgi:biopolymer transport protein ExbB/biopolymer transport protein TolQ
VGLFGTVFGINAFRGMKNAESAGIAAVGSISKHSLPQLGLLVAVPACVAVQLFHRQGRWFVVEMDNSASELVDYFIKNAPSS